MFVKKAALITLTKKIFVTFTFASRLKLIHCIIYSKRLRFYNKKAFKGSAIPGRFINSIGHRKTAFS